MKNKLNILKKRLALLAVCSTISLSGCTKSPVEDNNQTLGETEIETLEGISEEVSETNDELLTEAMSEVETTEEELTTEVEDNYSYDDVVNFQGTSIKVLLQNLNLPYDIEFRSRLAKMYGVVQDEKEYVGTVAQNNSLVAKIKELGMVLVRDKNSNEVVGIQNAHIDDVIYLDKNVNKTEDNKVTNDKNNNNNTDKVKHEHKYILVNYTFNNNDKHIATYKCAEDGSVVTKEQNCTKAEKKENGYVITYCTKCGHVYSKVQEQKIVHTHNHTEVVSKSYKSNDKHIVTYKCPTDGDLITKEENCTKAVKKENGYVITYCTGCGHVYSNVKEEQPVHEHSFTEFVSVNYKSDDQHEIIYKCSADGTSAKKTENCSKATKKENGYIVTYCTKCGHVYSKVQEQQPVHEHSYTEFVSVNYKSVDQHNVTYRCPADGNTKTTVENCTKATKEENGYIITYCTSCGHVYSSVKKQEPVHEHSYDVVVSKVYKSGDQHEVTYKCSADNETKVVLENCTKTTRKEGKHTLIECKDCKHDFNSHELEYITEGCEFWSVCSCGEKIEIVDYKHTEDKGTKDENPKNPDVCYTMTYNCSNCGTYIRTESENHIFGDYTDDFEMCDNCGKTREKASSNSLDNEEVLGLSEYQTFEYVEEEGMKLVLTK